MDDSDPQDDTVFRDGTGLAAHAAAELGVAVPPDFLLLGVGDDAKHIALNSGDARDIRYGAAILGRLDGKSINECLTEMSAPVQSGPEPEWAPPSDWTDRDAWMEYLAKRQEHPEWPQIFNGGSEWIPYLASPAGLAAVAAAVKSVLNLQARRTFAKFVVEKAVGQGVPIDPAEVIRAFEGSPSIPKQTAEHSDGEAGDEPKDQRSQT